MKKFFWAGLAAVLALSSCTANDFKKSPSREDIFAEINAEHQAIEKVQVSEDDLKKLFSERQVKPKPQEMETLQDSSIIPQDYAKNDIEYLFWRLSADYALYDYFGGDKVFDKAKENALKAVEQEENWTSNSLAELILQELSFIEDLHFNINFVSPTPEEFPGFYRSTAFYKTSDNEYKNAEGKTVISLDGFEDLSTLFKRSLNENGEIVYYPVVISGVSIPLEIKVNYSDGSSETVSRNLEYTSKYFTYTEEQSVIFSELEGIPLIDIERFYKISPAESNKIQEIAENNDVLIIDLRDNPGGYFSACELVWKNLTQQKVPSNMRTIMRYSQQDLEIKKTEDDEFIENDKIIIIFASKYSASSAELFMDMAHNVANTVIIGENSHGALKGGEGVHFTLPHSSIRVDYGIHTNIFPEGHFEELRGLEPDIWVHADDAEKLTLAMLKNWKKL